MTPGDKSRLIVAIAVNIGVGQIAAHWLGLPRWMGTIAAGGAMAAASVPRNLPPVARGVVQVAVLPGNLVAELLDDQAEKLTQQQGSNANTTQH